jgi:hypothetical protein
MIVEDSKTSSMKASHFIYKTQMKGVFLSKIIDKCESACFTKICNSYYSLGIALMERGKNSRFYRDESRRGKNNNKDVWKNQLVGVNIVFYEGGSLMELTAAELSAVNDEIKESQTLLEASVNQLISTWKILDPHLSSVTEEIRTKNKIISWEIGKTMTALKEITDFFTSATYKQKMNELKEFLELAESFKRFIDNGMLDNLTDIYLKNIEGGNNVRK